MLWLTPISVFITALSTPASLNEVRLYPLDVKQQFFMPSLDISFWHFNRSYQVV
jgi:hypothetical protein